MHIDSNARVATAFRDALRRDLLRRECPAELVEMIAGQIKVSFEGNHFYTHEDVDAFAVYYADRIAQAASCLGH